MNKFAPILLLLLFAGCSDSLVSSTPPVATFQRNPGCRLTYLSGARVEAYRTAHKGAHVWWDLEGQFYTTCYTNARVHIFYIAPDGKRTAVGSADAPVGDEFNTFSARFLVPKDWQEYEEPWYPHLLVEVTIDGHKVGSFEAFIH